MHPVTNEHAEGGDVTPPDTPYKRIHRSARPEGTRVRVGGVEIGGAGFVMAAGPCAVESRHQLEATARAVAAAGASILRGGAFKPRTSPYAFRGLGREGLEMLRDVGRELGMPVVTEVLDPGDSNLVADHADILQIGARNMQNYALLEAAGRTLKPVLLKRGLSATIEELLLAAEYVALQGNTDIILCERGIRTFETATRNTLDLGAAVLLGERTHLPVVVDPSHASGRSSMVAPLSMAAAAAGVAGLIVEVHPDPSHAMCDGAQSVPVSAFPALMDGVATVLSARGRAFSSPAASLDPATRLRLETERLEGLDRMLGRLAGERRAAGLRIDALQSKIGRPRRSVPEAEAREKRTMETHAAV